MPTYYGVFNGENFHPVTGQRLSYHYTEFEAKDDWAAKKAMWNALGSGWSDVTDTKPSSEPPDPKVLDWWKASGSTFMPYPGGAAYVKLEMPVRKRPRLGETVTLRVVLSEHMAKESALFIAGRCIGHRPGPMSPVLHGAGVWFEDNVWPAAWDGTRAFAIGGAGVVVLVRYVPKDRAEAAVAEDREHVSIVVGTSCRAWLGVAPDFHQGRREVSGHFTSEILYALGDHQSSAWEKLRDAAEATAGALEEQEDEEHTVVYELRDGRAVGARLLEGREDEVGDPSAVSGLFDEENVGKLAKLGMGFERLRGDARRAKAAVEAIKGWRDSIVGYEVESGRVVGVRMKSR